MIKSFELEKLNEWDKWDKLIPSIEFKSDYKVKMRPPFCGAIVRFCVEKGDKSVSVYLDCYSTLGSVSEPYWEAYPINDDTARFLMNDVEELIKTIENELSK